MAKKAKHSDAVMTGILVTKFKMGQIDVEDLEHMAADTIISLRKGTPQSNRPFCNNVEIGRLP